MATASVPMDKLEKELTCSICLNLLQEPKDLDCPHTYCFDCLTQYVQKKSTIDCPDCRYITIVPQGGLANLKTNLRIKNVVENLIQGTGQIGSRKQMEIPMCQDHIGERQHFFCVTCNIPVCRDCLVLKHPKPQHEIREWKEVMEEEEKQRRKKNQDLDDVERELKSAKDKVKQEVKSHIQRATTEINNWEKIMDQDIETTYQTRIKILQKIRKELNKPVTSGICKLSIQQDDELPHDMTIFRFKPGQLNLSKFGELVTTENKKLGLIGSSRCGRMIPTMNPNLGAKIRNPKFVTTENKNLVTSTNQKQVASSNKKLKLTLSTKFGVPNFSTGVGIHGYFPATSVAANQSNLIAFGSGPKNINIYGKYNGGYKQQCQLTLDNYPKAVAISSQGEFFVPDGGVVKIFSPAGKYENAWPKSIDAYRIAIAPDDMVVIGRLSGDAITVHKCDGELIRRHPIKNAVIWKT